MALILLSDNSLSNSKTTASLIVTDTLKLTPSITESGEQGFTDDSSLMCWIIPNLSCRVCRCDSQTAWLLSLYFLFFFLLFWVKLTRHFLKWRSVSQRPFKLTLCIKVFLMLKVSERRRPLQFNIQFTVLIQPFVCAPCLCLWVLMWTFATEPWNNWSTKWPCEFVYPRKP